MEELECTLDTPSQVYTLRMRRKSVVTPDGLKLEWEGTVSRATQGDTRRFCGLDDLFAVLQSMTAEDQAETKPEG